MDLTERSYAAVLFDLDGTLVDSIAVVERSWATWAAENGIESVPVHEFHGVPARQVLADLAPHLDIDAAFDRLLALEVADTEGLTVLPGASETLATLVDAGAHVAIVTSGTRPLLEARLSATGLRRPEVTVTADETPVGKPDPAPYLLAAERLGVDPAACLVVEDATAGLRSGQAAGAATLAVGTTSPAATLAADADLVVGGLHEVELVPGPDGIRVRLR